MAMILPFPVKKVIRVWGLNKKLRLPCRQIEKLGMAAVFLLAACSSNSNTFKAAKYPVGQSHSVDSGIIHALREGPRELREKPRELREESRRSWEKPGYDSIGIASWYGRRYHGRRTANGEIFDMNAPTAAHPTLPFGSRVHVTNLENGRSVTLRINDRGPFVRRRIIDVSHHVAEMLGFVRQGTTRVRVQLVQRGG